MNCAMRNLIQLTIGFGFALVFFLGIAQSAYAAPCHLTDVNDSVLTGFGAPYSLVSPTAGLLTIETDCDGSDVTVTAGSGSQSEYVYELGYAWTGMAWQQYSLMGAIKAGVWYQGNAAGILKDQSGTSHALAYICTWDGVSWKCGCRDSFCTQSFWQLQTFTVPTIPPPGTSTSTTSSSGGAVTGGTHTSTHLEEIAQEIHRLTNVERQNVGLPTLGYDDDLSYIAIGNSEDMAARNFFSHTDPDGCDFTCRYEKYGYVAQVWGENLAFIETNNNANLAQRFVDNWMNSPPHRKNILSSKYELEGVGISLIGQRYYATVNFAKPF